MIRNQSRSEKRSAFTLIELDGGDPHHRHPGESYRFGRV